MLPIMDGREIVGQASTKRSAERIIRRALNIHPRAKLHVWQRTPLQQELNGLPPAWIYSVSFGG